MRTARSSVLSISLAIRSFSPIYFCRTSNGRYGCNESYYVNTRSRYIVLLLNLYIYINARTFNTRGRHTDVVNRVEFSSVSQNASTTIRITDINDTPCDGREKSTVEILPDGIIHVDDKSRLSRHNYFPFFHFFFILFYFFTFSTEIRRRIDEIFTI